MARHLLSLVKSFCDPDSERSATGVRNRAPRLASWEARTEWRARALPSKPHPAWAPTCQLRCADFAGPAGHPTAPSAVFAVESNSQDFHFEWSREIVSAAKRQELEHHSNDFNLRRSRLSRSQVSLPCRAGKVQYSSLHS